MYAARRADERIYICTRQEGRKKGFTYVRNKKDGRKGLHMYSARRTEEGLTYVRGKKDGRKDLHMYAARRTEERVYICTRQEGRKKGFTYVRRKKDGRKGLHMYAARRTEEGIYTCTRQEGRKKGFKYVRGKKEGRKGLTNSGNGKENNVSRRKTAKVQSSNASQDVSMYKFCEYILG